MRPRRQETWAGNLLSGTGVIIVGLVLTIGALAFPIWSYADRSDAGPAPNLLSASSAVTTPYGPLSALDRDFVEKVRLAGLWEIPAGRQARQKGTTAAVRTAGEHLVEGHTLLDERVRSVAARLNLPLPDRPTDRQQDWLRELDAAQGTGYDWKFANVLRLAHGRIFSVVAQVRASTRNSLVRDLADDANATVLDHIRVLEATGYVDFDALARDLATDSPPPLTVPVTP